MREYGGRASKASQALIWLWLNNGTLVDAEWWPSIEFATSGAVTRRDLRPDVFAPSHAA